MIPNGFQEVQYELFRKTNGRRRPRKKEQTKEKKTLNVLQIAARKVRLERLKPAHRRMKPELAGLKSEQKASDSAARWRQKRLELFEPNGSKMMSQTQVERELQVPRNTVERWRKSGAFKCYISLKDRRKILYRRTDILAFIMKRTRLGSLRAILEKTSAKTKCSPNVRPR